MSFVVVDKLVVFNDPVAIGHRVVHVGVKVVFFDRDREFQFKCRIRLRLDGDRRCARFVSAHDSVFIDRRDIRVIRRPFHALIRIDRKNVSRKLFRFSGINRLFSSVRRINYRADIFFFPNRIQRIDRQIHLARIAFHHNACATGSWKREDLVRARRRVAVGKHFHTACVHKQVEVDRPVRVACRLASLNQIRQILAVRLGKFIRNLNTGFGTVECQRIVFHIVNNGCFFSIGACTHFKSDLLRAAFRDKARYDFITCSLEIFQQIVVRADFV